MTWLRTTCLALFVLALRMPSSGQTFGEITGVVADSTGGVVVGAIVTLTNTQTNATRTSSTNSTGNYSFPALLPGVYNVKAEMQGVQSGVRHGGEGRVRQVGVLYLQ